jgi:pimeloyl-ACP methyl ester carboxylesterase
MRLVLSLMLILMLLVALAGPMIKRSARDSKVTAEFGAAGSTQPETLYIWVHGFAPSSQDVSAVGTALRAHGDVLTIKYPAACWSRAEANPITKAIRLEAEREFGRRQYQRVVVVAYSVGALLARRALLDGLHAEESWAKAVSRVVLLAGMNRGWNSRAEKPADLNWTDAVGSYVGEWFAEFSGTFDFLLQFRAGAPFVVNLRLEWMERMRSAQVEVVQLLGDIDDVVSTEDSQDLRTMGTDLYRFLRVRGSGHGEILDLADKDLGNHRRSKLISAVTLPFDRLKADSEDLPFNTDDSIEKVVFVLHGIRDLGRWSSVFDDTIRKEGIPGVRIISPRYGYLGMGPFLLEGVRDKYVRWLMDEYTETLARYPCVEQSGIRFFAHSNGTYLLADALRQYQAMKLDRIIFAGSVVPTDYDWAQRVKDGQVNRVRNYVATSDWVVALFPRLFEYRPVKWIGNALGGAGHDGFDFTGVAHQTRCATPPAGAVPLFENVCYIKGQHSAYSERISEIVAYILDEQPKQANTVNRPGATALWLSGVSTWAVWTLLVCGVAYLGVRLVSAAPSPSWVVFALFVFLVVRALQTL